MLGKGHPWLPHLPESAESKQAYQTSEALVETPSCGCFPKLGILFGGPFNKDSNIFGSIWGPPIWGNYLVPLETLQRRAVQDRAPCPYDASRKNLRCFLLCVPSSLHWLCWVLSPWKKPWNAKLSGFGHPR